MGYIVSHKSKFCHLQMRSCWHALYYMLQWYVCKLLLSRISHAGCESLVIANGQLNSTDTIVGTVVSVKCNAGYTLLGSNLRECVLFWKYWGAYWRGDTKCLGKSDNIYKTKLNFACWSSVFVIYRVTLFAATIT